MTSKRRNPEDVGEGDAGDVVAMLIQDEDSLMRCF